MYVWPQIQDWLFWNKNRYVHTYKLFKCTHCPSIHVWCGLWFFIKSYVRTYRLKDRICKLLILFFLTFVLIINRNTYILCYDEKWIFCNSTIAAFYRISIAIKSLLGNILELCWRYFHVNLVDHKYNNHKIIGGKWWFWFFLFFICDEEIE